VRRRWPPPSSAPWAPTRGLEKPPYQPPGPAFGAVWTPLYGLFAYGTARLLDAEPDPARRRRLAALAGADLAVNAGWCWAFFRVRRPSTSVAVIVVLDALNLALLLAAARRETRAAVVLSPYVAWCAFATVLNADIAVRNR